MKLNVQGLQCVFCISAIPFDSDFISFVEPHQADLFRGRTDFFHGKASGNITVILCDQWFVAFSSASQVGLMFSFDTSRLLSLGA